MNEVNPIPSLEIPTVRSKSKCESEKQRSFPSEFQNHAPGLHVEIFRDVNIFLSEGRKGSNLNKTDIRQFNNPHEKIRELKMGSVF